MVILKLFFYITIKDMLLEIMFFFLGYFKKNLNSKIIPFFFKFF